MTLAQGCPTHYKEGLYGPCCKFSTMLQILPLHNTSRKTFPSTSDEHCICLATRYHEARGLMTCQRDHRDPRADPGMELVSPKAQTLGLIIQHTSRLGARAGPKASISEGWGLWVTWYLICATSFPKETLWFIISTLWAARCTQQRTTRPRSSR